MSDIFISYASEDRAWARMLAQKLEEQGWSVWWDREIPFAKPFDEVIEDELTKARSVIVIWSNTSVTKRWVRTEAGEGLDRDVLIPVLMEEVRPPLQFRQLQGASLIEWQGDSLNPEFKRLSAALLSLLGKAALTKQEERKRAEDERKRAEEEHKRAGAEAERQAEEERKRPEAEAKRKVLLMAFIAGLVLLVIGGVWYLDVRLEAEIQRQQAGAEVERKLAEVLAERQAEQESKRAVALAERKAEEERKLAAAEVVAAITAPPVGKIINDCADCPEMVVVPAGRFTMGSPDSEPKRYSDEGPLHQVTISRPFAVGKYEVTFDQWDACVAGGGCNGHRPDDRGWGRGRRPVIKVSWDDAKAYVRWLSGKTRQEYRLLSEAEWEYVARAGTSTPFSTGSTISPDQANYDGKYAYGSGRTGVYRQRTVPVGSFSSNDFGLYDVHGNVLEWTEDCWHDGYHGAPGNGGAWTTGGECDERVLRGGSWNAGPRLLRSATRHTNYTDERGFNFIGFRVARTL